MLARIFTGLFVWVVSSTSFAVDFSEADALFQQRESNPQTIDQALQAYAQIASQATGSELIYAYEQMSRLRFYQGLSLNKRQERIATALKCANDIEAIRTVDGVTPIAYYYWKGLCLISWGRYNVEVDPIGTLSRTSEMQNVIEAGIDLDPTYEGGGCHRVGAAFYATLPAINLGGPTRDLDRAARYADLAIQSAAHSLELDPATATGDYFYKVFEAKARIQWVKRDLAGARATVQGALARIEAGDIPLGREPETKLDERDLRELLKEIGR